MGKQSIQNIVEDAAKRGHDVRIRDIAYALIKARFDDDLIAYSVVFGNPDDDKSIEAYNDLASSKYLVRLFTKEYEQPAEDKPDPGQELIDAIFNNKKQDSNTDLTFEENKAAMIELIERTEEALELGKIDTDKGLKIMADLRVKLNDKFGTAEKSNEQYIIVQPKFNTVCPYTRKECWQQTKEFAMEHWHLIPDPKYKL